MEKTTTNRREFLKKSALITTSGLVLPHIITQACAAPVQQKGKLGIALVGLGYYSNDVLAPAFQHMQHGYLAGIVSGTPSKAETWMKKHNISEKNVYNYQNFDEIAKNRDIDVVYVVLPNSMHKEFVIRAANAGKHVICEKPMAVSAADCREMIAACEKNKVSLAIGYRMQHEATTQELMKWAKEKPFGAIRQITASAGYRESRLGHWKTQKAMGGGAMMDMGVYSLQAARYSAGMEPIAVTAQSFVSRPDIFKDVEETMLFQLEFPEGVLANLHTSFGVGVNSLQVNCEKGWYRLDPFSSYSGIKGESSKGPISFPQPNQQAKQMDEACLSILQKKPQLVPGEEGLRDLVIVEAIYQAAATGQRVKLSS